MNNNNTTTNTSGTRKSSHPKSNPFHANGLPNSNLAKLIKKAQIDVSLGVGFNTGQNKNNSRNFQLPSGSHSTNVNANNLSSTQNDLQSLRQMTQELLLQGSPTGRQASNNHQKFPTQTNHTLIKGNNPIISSTQFNDNKISSDLNNMSPEQKRTSLYQNKKNSKRNLNAVQQQQQNNTNSNQGGSGNSNQNQISYLQSTGLVKDLKRGEQQQQTQQIFPPMIQGQKQHYSRNQAYKASLSENVYGKIQKGQSPKSNAVDKMILYSERKRNENENNQYNAAQLENENLEESQQKQRSGSNLSQSNQASKSIGPQVKSRNIYNSLGEGQNRPQYYTMRGSNTNSNTNNSNNSNNHLQLHQSPQGRFNSTSQTRNNGNSYQQIYSQISSFPSQPIEQKMEFDPTVIFTQNYEPAKFASKRNGVVVSYAANTHQGIVRNYNEDRVSIILNIIKPKFKDVSFWPRCSFFGVYDGHGGAACADYLRDQLHQLIVKDVDFPGNPKKAIEKAFIEAEKTFLEYAEFQAVAETGQIDRSGSCAVIVLIVGDMCYVGNVGDSRGIMSVDGGEKILLLSKDHKPESEEETERIQDNGGRIYQNSNYIPDMTPGKQGQMQLIVGPHRVFPGRLSVSRTIGDIEAKLTKFGGNPKVVVPTADIKCFKIRNNYDYIIIACDGVFEKLTNQDVMNAVWSTSRLPSHLQKLDNRSIHEKCGQSIDKILHESVFKKTFDNITAVMIAFENFENIAGDSQNNNQEVKDMQVQSNFLQPVQEEELQENEETDTPQPEYKPIQQNQNDSQLPNLTKQNQEDSESTQKSQKRLQSSNSRYTQPKRNSLMIDKNQQSDQQTTSADENSSQENYSPGFQNKRKKSQPETLSNLYPNSYQKQIQDYSHEQPIPSNIQNLRKKSAENIRASRNLVPQNQQSTVFPNTGRQLSGSPRSKKQITQGSQMLPNPIQSSLNGTNMFSPQQIQRKSLQSNQYTFQQRQDDIAEILAQSKPDQFPPTSTGVQQQNQQSFQPSSDLSYTGISKRMNKSSGKQRKTVSSRGNSRNQMEPGRTNKTSSFEVPTLGVSQNLANSLVGGLQQFSPTVIGKTRGIEPPVQKSNSRNKMIKSIGQTSIDQQNASNQLNSMELGNFNNTQKWYSNTQTFQGISNLIKNNDKLKIASKNKKVKE